MSRGRRVQGAVAAALIVAGLALAPAGATGSTRTASASATGNASIASATAKCKSGQRATGGGFAGFPTTGGGGFPVYLVFESRKVGQRSWKVSGQEDFSPSGSFTITAYVYCSKDAAKTKERSVTVPHAQTPSGAFFSADATCGSAGKVMAGGFSSPAPVLAGNSTSQLVVDSIRVGTKTWRVRGAGGGVGAPSVTSYAYCAKAPAPKEKAGSVSVAGSATNGTAVSASCKHGKPFAGGFSQPNGTLTPASNLYFTPYQSIRNGKGWQAVALHFGTGSTTLVSTAYCPA